MVARQILNLKGSKVHNCHIDIEISRKFQCDKMKPFSLS
jgi:hypothetical protein